MKKLGLVGGISWVSTIDYYRLINEEINKRLGGLNYAECIIYSLNFGDIQAVTWDHSFDLLLKACQSLKNSGAGAIVLCANTAHLEAERLKASIELPIIHIVEATAAVIRNKGIKKIGLLGTKFTMEKDLYTTRLRKNNIECIVPEQQEVRDFIQYTLKEELGKGIIKAETKEKYIDFMKRLIERGAEGIILGCTEIPMMISQEDVSFPVFDTTKIHAAAAVEFALSK